MTNLLSISEYAELNSKQKNDYIKEKLKIQELWIIGKVKFVELQKSTMMYVDFHINPYNGKEMSQMLFRNEKKIRSIKCYNSNNHKLENGSTVLVKFNLVINKKEMIEKRQVFRTSLNNIFEINLNEAEKILSMIEISNDEIAPLALTYPNVYSLALSQINVEKLFDKSNQMRLDILEENKKILLEKKEIEQRIEIEKNEILSKHNEIDLRIEAQKEELKNINTKLNAYGFNLIPEEKDSTSAEPDVVPESLESLIHHLHFELAEQSLVFEIATLRRVVRSLKTEQMIILSGPSGTGKTTLVSELANIIKANIEIIPVQPSWTDKQDLFGFYNPIQRLYVPSPFLDCLIRANQNPNKLHIVCLDEMNLAQIEYYLADFLSLKETKSSQLRLYSEFEYEQNKREVNWYLTEYLNILDSEEKNISKINPIQHTDMISRQNNLQRYPDVIKIPNNIRVIGTMNVEGQVQSLSPKVTDRSYVIPLYKQRPMLNLSTEIVEHAYNIPASYFKNTDSKKDILFDEVRIALSHIKTLLEEIGIDYNSRYEKHILKYLNADLESKTDYKFVLDDLILLKILPRIHDSISEPTFIDRLEQLVQECVHPTADSLKKLQLMRQRYSQTSLYSYWS